MSKPYTGPLPSITTLNRPFWEGLVRHELTLPKCNACGLVWYPPSPWCPDCYSSDFIWAKLSGRGCVNSWAELQAVPEGFEDGEATPTNAVEVTLDEGPRLISNLVAVALEDIFIGMPVEIIFEDVTDYLTLARFRPAKNGHSRTKKYKNND